MRPSKVFHKGRTGRDSRRGEVMAHDRRLVKDDDAIEELRKTIPDWIMRLERPAPSTTAAMLRPFSGAGSVRGRHGPLAAPSGSGAAADGGGARGSPLATPESHSGYCHS